MATGNGQSSGVRSERSDSGSQIQPTAPDRLDSWKEIAAYLNRDVRTVRRWEKSQGLPVHRHLHERRSSIYAYRSELERWWQAEQAKLKEGEGTTFTPAGIVRPTRFFGGAVVIALVTVLGLAYVWQRARRPPPASSRMMLVVLPFQNLTGEPAQEFLSDGLTEEIITQVAKIHQDRLGVIARTSAMAYKSTSKSISDIAQELQVDYVLEGSLRRWGDHLRVSAQLIDARNQAHIWAESYERSDQNILQVQGEVAQEVAQHIRLQLLPQTPVHSSTNARPVAADVHELYQRARYHFNLRTRDDLQKSVELLRQAIVKDPEYAAAYAALADDYNLIGFYGFDPSLNSVAQAKIAAEKALQLDDSIAAAHAALAYTDFMWQEDWGAAEHEFQRALKLDDNYVPSHQWYALFLAANGQTEQALNQMQYAHRLDPLSPAIETSLAYVVYFARDYEQAAQHAKTALGLSPNSMAAHAVLGWVYSEQHKYDDAIKELQSAVKLSSGVPVYRCALARAYALSGDTTKARKVLEEVVVQKHSQKELQGDGTSIAAAFLALGQTDEALQWLERTAPGDIQANWLRVDPAFDGVRQNPRFVAVLERIGRPSTLNTSMVSSFCADAKMRKPLELEQ